jgi:hypothetical protein
MRFFATHSLHRISLLRLRFYLKATGHVEAAYDSLLQVHKHVRFCRICSCSDSIFVFKLRHSRQALGSEDASGPHGQLWHACAVTRNTRPFSSVAHRMQQVLPLGRRVCSSRYV